MDELNSLMSNSALVGGSGLVAVIAAALIWMRKFLSADSVDRAKDGAEIDAITRLQQLLTSEREARQVAEARADKFAAERNDAITALGDMKAEVAKLRSQVEMLQNEITRLGKVIEAPK